MSPLARAKGAAPPKQVGGGETVFSGSRFQRTRDWKFVSAPHPLTGPASRVPAELRARFEAGEQGFDLGQDPEEDHNLMAPGQDVPSHLADLRRWALSSEPPGTGRFDPAELDAGRTEELRALGYLE